MQADLFDTPRDGGTGFNITRCGLCVHKSGGTDEDGVCSPMGQRRWNDETCDWRFGREQLREALRKMPRSA